MNAPYRPHFSICPSDFVLDGQCYRSTPLRQAGLLHCWRCRTGVASAGTCRSKMPQLLRHLANREIHRSTICLLEISCGWLLFEVGYEGDFFLLTSPFNILKGCYVAVVSAVDFSTRFCGVITTGKEFLRSLRTVSACSCLMESLLFQILGHGPQQ